MKDLTHCPACKKELYKGTDSLSSYSSCRCPFDYILRYKKDQVTPNYVNFEFTKFFATIYFDAEPPYPKNKIIIYSQAHMKEYGSAYPIVRAKAFEPDFSDLIKLEDRINMMVTFS